MFGVDSEAQAMVTDVGRFSSIFGEVSSEVTPSNVFWKENLSGEIKLNKYNSQHLVWNFQVFEGRKLNGGAPLSVSTLEISQRKVSQPLSLLKWNLLCISIGNLEYYNI